MNDHLQSHDFFIRRWQVRLVIAAFTLAPLLFVLLALGLERHREDSMIACAVVAASLLFTSFILEGFRIRKSNRNQHAKFQLNSPSDF